MRLGLKSAVRMPLWPFRSMIRTTQPCCRAVAAARFSVIPSKVRVSKLPGAETFGLFCWTLTGRLVVGHQIGPGGRLIEATLVCGACVAARPPHPAAKRVAAAVTDPIDRSVMPS
jgi:hypothetical protein